MRLCNRVNFKSLNQVLFWSGYYAVITFFVISGFLITGLSIKRWGQYAYLSCMDGIAFGCLAALACARLSLSPRTLRIALATGAITACLVIMTCSEDSHTGLARFGLNVTALEAGVAMMLVTLGNGVGNATLSLGTRWVRVIGRSSYEIYLVHMLVVLGLMGLFKRLQPATSMIPLWYLAMFLLSVLIGLAISRYYSEPLNRLLRAQDASAHPGVKDSLVPETDAD